MSEAMKAPARWIFSYGNKFLPPAMVPRANGDWVKWADVEAIILEHSEAASPQKFVIELAGIYGLDENFLRALPVPSLEMWQMLVREEAKRHKSERETMEKFRAELIQLKFGAASPQGTPELCPSCNSPLIFAVGCANAWHSLAEKRLVNSPAKCSTFREWLIDGGGGHEDGEAGIRACTLPLSLAIEMVEEYLEYRAGTQVEALPDKCPECGSRDKAIRLKVWIGGAGYADDDFIPPYISCRNPWHSTVAAQPCQQARKTPESSSRTGGIAPTHVEQAGSHSAAQKEKP